MFNAMDHTTHTHTRIKMYQFRKWDYHPLAVYNTRLSSYHSSDVPT